MRKQKLGVFLGTIGLAAVTGITGCASSNQAAPSEPATTDAGASAEVKQSSNAPVQIDFWYSVGGANGEMIEKLVKEYNESQKNIVVKPAYQGNYYENHTKVLSSVTAGNQPDVTMVEIASVGAFADAKVLEDLGSYAAGSEKKYIEGLMGNSYWEDKLYAIPFNRSTPLLYINRDMLKAAGLDPNGPKTWDEMRSFAEKMTKKDGGKTSVFGYSSPIDIWFYEAMVFQSGGEILSDDGKKLMINSEAGKAPLQYWTDMMKEGTMKAPPGEKYNAWDVASQDFLNQQVAMIFTTTGELKNMREKAKFDVGTAFLPANKSYGTPTGGANLVVLKKSPEEEKKAAFDFISWMTDTAQTTRWSAATGYMPVTNDALEAAEMKAVFDKDPNFKVAVDQLQYGKPRPMVPGYKELQEVIMTEIQKVVLGQSTIDDALKQAETKSEKLLKK
ncbi:ABC transporter substrate-binding protein [Brevibacillus daliensis]|uniref:ABC transporter substrate-binding protein n=1 Tax=Brevibacillus daliensis TaxID=2892995 RepID=UPI001E4F7628|nr:ABC transporter substrate-binding protein [Brevibacillus daliensis]